MSVERRGDRLIILENNEKNTIKSLKVGERLNDKFHRKWQRSSKMRYGNVLLSWSKFLNQKFTN